MPNMQLTVAGNPVTIAVDEPRRCELFRAQLEEAGTLLAQYAGAVHHARVRPALVNNPGGDQNLSELLSLLAGILDIQVAPAIAREIGANDVGNPLQAFYWQGVSPVDAAAGGLGIPDAQPAGLVAYCRFVMLCLDRNFDPAAALPDQGAVDGRDPAGYRGQGIASFFGRHADLQARAQVVALQFSQYVTAACDRLLGDWADIQRYFFGGQAIANLLKIKATGSDTHKGGQQVAILTLSGNRRLVYKPTDVEWDALIAGDVESLAAMANQLQGNAAATVARWNNVAATNGFDAIPGLGTRRSLAQLFNSFLPTGDIFTAGKPRLPVYRILPCSAGSTLAVGGDGSRNIRNSYGYIEFLYSDPVQDRTFPSAQHASFRNYSYQIGQWLALMVLGNIGDMHQENLFICNKRPYPIDMEVVNFGFCDHLDSTLLVSTGITNMPELVMKFGLVLEADRVLWEYVKIPDPNGDDYMNNQAFDVHQHQLTPAKADIAPGFSDALRVLRQRVPSFAAFMTGLLPGVVVRRLVPGLGTADLFGHLRAVLGLSDVLVRQYCTQAAAPRLGAWETKAVQWRQAYPAFTELVEPRRQAATRQEAEDLNTKGLVPDFATYGAAAEDFIAGDIPAFYQAYGETRLLNSEGRPITVDPAQQAPVGHQTVLQLYPWAVAMSGDGRIANVIPRAQLAVQVKFLRDLAQPPQSAYDLYLQSALDYLH